MTKTSCIEKICNLPADIKTSKQSSFARLQASKFADFYNDITEQDIQGYLSQHKHLIADWELWSADKRTSGYYLFIHSDSFFVGSLDKDGKQVFSKSYATAEDACAEFIRREVCAILEISM